MSNVLSEFSNALAATVAAAAPSIVRVDGRRRQSATGIIWTEDGVVVTADHVVRKDDAIQIEMPDGELIPANLLGRDRTTDVAILRVEAAGLIPLVEANKQTMTVGQMVLALGRPGHTVQATFGILSAIGKSWRTMLGGQIDRYVQTDVVMYPGFSGGPLVNAQGHLVGMNTSALHPGVSLVVPFPTLDSVARSLLAHGHVRRGYLGVSSQRVRLPEAVREEIEQSAGLLIISVEPESPADKAGLTLGDTIVALADSAVSHHEDLLALLTGDIVGTAVPLRIVRSGQVMTVSVTIGERP